MYEFMHLTAMTLVVCCVPFLIKNFVPLPSENIVKIEKGSSGRYSVFDVMRGIAILGVVLSHAGYLYIEMFTPSSNVYVELIDASVRFVLPIFFIASGVLLVPAKKTIKGHAVFLWGRFIELLPLYIIFTGLLAYVGELTFHEFLKNIITGEGSLPYYFILVLIQLYILYPFIEKYAQKRMFVYLTLFFAMVMQFTPSTWYLYGVPLAFRYLFFFVWGIYIREQLLSGTFTRKVAPWLIMVFLFFVMYLVFPGQFYNVRPYYGVAMFSLLFVFFTSPHVTTRLEQYLEKVGRMSYWVYLAHFPVMQFVFGAFVFLENVHSVITYSVLVVVGMVVSVLSGWLVKNIHMSAQTVLLGK